VRDTRFAVAAPGWWSARHYARRFLPPGRA